MKSTKSHAAETPKARDSHPWSRPRTVLAEPRPAQSFSLSSRPYTPPSDRERAAEQAERWDGLA